MGSPPRLRGGVRIPRRSARARNDRVASRGGVGGASPYEGRELPVCFRVSGRVVQGGQFLRRAAPPSRYGRRFEESERLLAAVGGETGVYAELGRSGRILILVAGVHYLSDSEVTVCQRPDTPEPSQDLRPHEAGFGSMGRRRSLAFREPSVPGQGRVVVTQGEAGCVRPRVGAVRRFLGEPAHQDRGRTVPAPGAQVRQEWKEGTQTESDGRGVRDQPRATAYKITVPSIRYLGSRHSMPPGYASSSR